MTPKTKHTKTPWIYNFNTDPTKYSSHYGYQLLGNKGKESICYDLNEANAKLIIKAVNNHEELVEALRFCMLACSQSCPPEFNLNAAYKKSKQALTKAESED